MKQNRKDQIRKLLKGIETGDPEAVAVVNESKYIQHNPNMADGFPALREELSSKATVRKHDKIHRLLAEGNFVLCISEGSFNEVQTSFFDLFRIKNGKVVEHWDTMEAVPAHADWKNNNGKFQCL